MNLLKITLYSVLKEHFFDLPYNINCDPREYVGCTNVDRYFDIERVEREELVDIGLGVKISRPVVVERELNGGVCIFSSLSHNGVLVIYYYESGHRYQLTDLVNEKQIEIRVEDTTQTGFYDDSMVILTWFKPLRVCSMEDMFLNKSVSFLRGIGDVKVSRFADVSLLNSTRTLVFRSVSHIPYEFNVDTELIRELDIGKKISSFASLTGIDIGVKGLFREIGNDDFTFSLNSDNSMSFVSKYDPGCDVCTFIPSPSDPKDLKNGMKIHFDGSFFTDTTEGLYLTTPFRYQYFQSIIRLYQDIFLVYDDNANKWCLVKIVVL